MKRIFSLLPLAILAIAAITATSCKNDDDKDTVVDLHATNCFEHISDISSGTSAFYEGMAYGIHINYTQSTANIEILGLRLPNGTQYPSINLVDVPFTIDAQDWIEIAGANIAATCPGAVHAPTMTTFNMRLKQRTIDGNFIPAFSVYFSMDYLYSVLSAQGEQMSWGTTTTKAADGGVSVTNATVYYVNINVSTRTADITLNGASFISGMPPMNIRFPNVPFTVTGNKMVFEQNALIPFIGDTPYTRFPITGLYGQLDFGKGFELDFTCTPGSMPGASFDVSFVGQMTQLSE